MERYTCHHGVDLLYSFEWIHGENAKEKHAKKIQSKFRQRILNLFHEDDPPPSRVDLMMRRISRLMDDVKGESLQIAK